MDGYQHSCMAAYILSSAIPKGFTFRLGDAAGEDVIVFHFVLNAFDLVVFIGCEVGFCDDDHIRPMHACGNCSVNVSHVSSDALDVVGVDTERVSGVVSSRIKMGGISMGHIGPRPHG